MSASPSLVAKLATAPSRQVALALALATLACSDPTSPPEPAGLAIATPPSANAVNRVPFPTQPVVRLQTASGNAVSRAGIPVTVALTSGGGALVGTLSAITDADGRASFTGLEIQGLAGAKILTFSAPGLTPTSANVTTVGGVANLLELEAGDVQVEGEGLPVPIAPAVKATDIDGNAAPGTTVTFTVTEGEGSVVNATPITNSDGIASVTSWTLGAEGLNTLRANAEGIATAVTFSATALRLAVSSVTVTSPTTATLTAHTTRQYSAVANDSVGRPLANRTVTWSSADTTIASVSGLGLVRGELPGTADVHAASEGITGSLAVTVVAPTLTLTQGDSTLTGHFGSDVNAAAGPPAGFGYGFGYYSAIHELSEVHAERSQLGWGSWMMPDNRTVSSPLCPVGTVARDNWPERGPSYQDVYQNIEGGVGKWGSTRFPHPLTKFRVNATPDCYNTQIASSAWNFGGELVPNDKLGLAQLSNRLLVPPDGLVFSTGGTLFGNAWIALPLIPAYTAPSGMEVGDQSWTMFIRASNFSGPVTFYTPETWTRVHISDATGRGLSHDALPMFARSLSMEMGTLTSFTGIGPDGIRYRRIPRLTFSPAGGQSVLQQEPAFYSKQAIWDGFATWMATGTAVTAFNQAGVMLPDVIGSYVGVRFGPQDIVFPPSFYVGSVTTSAARPAFGIRWTGGEFEDGVFPEYYRETGAAWTAIPESEVPRTTWLMDQTFPALARGSFPAVNTGATAPFSAANWAAGPFVATLSDGSSVEFVWYRFVEQPAIQRLGLSAEALATLQTFVESFHEQSGTMGISIAAPASGTLATLDAALLVTPPSGLEKGYVPVVIRQY